MTATCPECEAKVDFGDDTVLSEILQCPDCGAELELVSLNPPALETAPEEDEDWGE